MKTTNKLTRASQMQAGRSPDLVIKAMTEPRQRFAAWSMTPSCRVAIHGDRSSRMTQSMTCASQTNFITQNIKPRNNNLIV